MEQLQGMGGEQGEPARLCDVSFVTVGATRVGGGIGLDLGLCGEAGHGRIGRTG
jgi:hypothetical protein